MCTISRNKFKRHFFKNKRLFDDFLLIFWNEHGIYNILRKKMNILAILFEKLLTAEKVVT